MKTARSLDYISGVFLLNRRELARIWDRDSGFLVFLGSNHRYASIWIRRPSTRRKVERSGSIRGEPRALVRTIFHEDISGPRRSLKVPRFSRPTGYLLHHNTSPISWAEVTGHVPSWRHGNKAFLPVLCSLFARQPSRAPVHTPATSLRLPLLSVALASCSPRHSLSLSLSLSLSFSFSFSLCLSC